MKTLLIIFFSIAIAFPAISQINWLTTGAKWAYDFSSYGSYGLSKLEVTKVDTTIGNHIYKKLLSTIIYVNTGTINTSLDTIIETSYAYEENNIVYGYEPNLFPFVNILYDFNRAPDDTLEFMFFGGQSPYPFVVDSVGTLKMNGSTVAFQDINFPDIFNPGQLSKMRVIEGLGSMDSYFFHTHTILQPFDAPSYHFRCYEDSNVGLINLSYNQVDCDYLEGVTSITEATKVKATVSPNPSNDFVTVITEGQLIDKIYIVDILGEIRKIKIMTSQELLTLDISELENGLFFMFGKDKTGKIRFTQKITKYGS
ncbi:MAG: T9SS type A sorting domain-containing protein [Saprospiraceae bacterium]